MRLLAIIFILTSFSLSAQNRSPNQDYVEKYYAIAVRKMVEYKIPASITLAQGILESGNGNSKLAQNANNHFGIKCHSEWTGKGYYMDDDAKDECFRVYKNAEESFADHSEFLTSRARYKFLFTDLKIDDYKGWAKGLKDAGYATNPRYPELLISLIERNNLQQYDKMGLNDLIEVPINDKPLVENNNTEDVKGWDAELPKNSYYTDAKKDVFIYNKAKTVKSKDRQLLAIATEYDINVNRLMKYNDMHSRYEFTPNQYVYLQPKRNKGTEKTHIVQPGETMWEISQKYAIKMEKLYKKNNMVFDKQAKAGETIYLRKKRKDVPKTISYKDVIDQQNKILAEEEAKKQAIIDAEKKAKEAEAKKLLEEKLAAQKKAAELQAKLELEQREKEALAKQLAAEKAKLEAEKLNNSKADPTEVEIEKPYEETTVKTYTVKAGDTLYSLSNKFYLTVEKLKELNNLTDNNLTIGQILIVSPK